LYTKYASTLLVILNYTAILRGVGRNFRRGFPPTVDPRRGGSGGADGYFGRSGGADGYFKTDILRHGYYFKTLWSNFAVFCNV